MGFKQTPPKDRLWVVPMEFKKKITYAQFELQKDFYFKEQQRLSEQLDKCLAHPALPAAIFLFQEHKSVPMVVF